MQDVKKLPVRAQKRRVKRKQRQAHAKYRIVCDGLDELCKSTKDKHSICLCKKAGLRGEERYNSSDAPPTTDAKVVNLVSRCCGQLYTDGAFFFAIGMHACHSTNQY
eukprot:4020175-Pleurochrysis_carterae.AAC.7